VETELKALEAELETEIAKLAGPASAAELQVEPLAVRPRKADIAVGRLALLWASASPVSAG
jgi:hypothetical protein